MSLPGLLQKTLRVSPHCGTLGGGSKEQGVSASEGLIQSCEEKVGEVKGGPSWGRGHY